MGPSNPWEGRPYLSSTQPTIHYQEAKEPPVNAGNKETGGWTVHVQDPVWSANVWESQDV